MPTPFKVGNAGKPETVAFVAPPNQNNIDYEKLAHAIAFAETGECKDGTAIKRKNCVGIRYHGQPAYYASWDASIVDAKRIWMKSYILYPNKKLATKWTGNDHPDRWLAAVDQYYNSH